MPLYEHMPYTNYENVNLDWIAKTVKAHDTDITQLKENVTNIQNTISAIEGSITNIETNITQIFEQLGDIDVDDLEARITALEEYDQTLHGMINNVLARVMGDEEDIAANTTNITNNDLSSVNRDNALSARISALERATLHDIYNYYSEGNQCLFGSDLRKLPSACKYSDGYPISWGSTSDRAEGETQARTFKFTDNGMQVNSDSSGYDYYQVGKYCSGLFNGSAYTVTFAVSTGGDATPAWYSHTFQSFGEQWEVATGCVIKAQNFYRWTGADDFYKTIAFLGTPANWSTFLNGKYIVYIFVEQGTGSVDTTATSKALFDVKDRLAFIEMAEMEPTIPDAILKSQTIIGQTTSGWELPAYYIDQVGEQVNYYLPLSRCGIYLWLDSSRHIFTGYMSVRILDTDQSQQSTQLAGLTENGCFVDTSLTIPTGNIGSLSMGTISSADMSTLDIAKNVNIAGSLYKSGNDLKIHIKIQSSGFSFAQTTGVLGSFQLFGFSSTAIS